MFTTQTTPLTKALNTLNIAKKGPKAGQYELVNHLLDNLYREMTSTEEAKLVLKEELKEIGTLKDVDSMLGHMLLKPFGYAGDFMIIDKVYQQHMSLEHSDWDKYLHQLPATQAVINRKAFVKSMLINKLLVRKQPLRFLNIASGPARDLKEVYDFINPNLLSTTCVEIDERAIAHASELCKPYMDRIDFVNKNVFKYEPEEKFDLVWSAGLFDYFDDKTFVKMIRKLYDCVSPGGELVVGNFSLDNPNRSFMEVMVDWVLHHRSAEHLIELAVEAGVKREHVSMDCEPLGINLFMRMKK